MIASGHCRSDALMLLGLAVTPTADHHVKTLAFQLEQWCSTS